MRDVWIEVKPEESSRSPQAPTQDFEAAKSSGLMVSGRRSSSRIGKVQLWQSMLRGCQCFFNGKSNLQVALKTAKESRGSFFWFYVVTMFWVDIWQVQMERARTVADQEEENQPQRQTESN